MLILFLIIATPALPCTSPLILDLTGDGIQTAPPEGGVHFDIDSDDTVELTGWTDPASGDAFLVLDLNGNGTIDSGLELFGNRTRLPDGAFAENGFEALAVYDRAEHGGDQDGLITQNDAIWERLELWQDDNHNGRTEKEELSRLAQHQVVGIQLRYRTVVEYDDVFNLHQFQGVFFRSVWPVLDVRPHTARDEPVLRPHAVHDVWFRVFDPNGR